MAESPYHKTLKELTEAQKLTNENLLKINESIKAQMSGVRDAIKEPPKKDIEEIAKIKLKDLNAGSLDSAMKIIEGSARSMGIDVAE